MSPEKGRSTDCDLDFEKEVGCFIKNKKSERHLILWETLGGKTVSWYQWPSIILYRKNSSRTERETHADRGEEKESRAEWRRGDGRGEERRGEGRRGGGGSGGGLEYPSKSDQFMLLNSSRRLLKAGGGLGSMLVYRWWEIISYSPQPESPDSCSYQHMKYWGHDRSGTLNDISVCCSSRATRIPRGWMGQFRSRSEYKLIRELGERVSIKETWIELCLSFQLSGFSWTCM